MNFFKITNKKTGKIYTIHTESEKSTDAFLKLVNNKNSVIYLNQCNAYDWEYGPIKKKIGFAAMDKTMHLQFSAKGGKAGKKKRSWTKEHRNNWLASRYPKKYNKGKKTFEEVRAEWQKKGYSANLNSKWMPRAKRDPEWYEYQLQQQVRRGKKCADAVKSRKTNLFDASKKYTFNNPELMAALKNIVWAVCSHIDNRKDLKENYITKLYDIISKAEHE